MKKFVKGNSIFITVVLTITCVVGILSLPQCAVQNYRWLKLGPETRDLDRLSHMIGGPFAFAALCAETVFFGILIAEIVIVIRKLMQALDEDTFSRFWGFSELAAFAIALNFIAFMIFSDDLNALSGDGSHENGLWVFLYFVLGICVVINLIRCRKGKEEEGEFTSFSGK